MALRPSKQLNEVVFADTRQVLASKSEPSAVDVDCQPAKDTEVGGGKRAIRLVSASQDQNATSSVTRMDLLEVEKYAKRIF